MPRKKPDRKRRNRETRRQIDRRSAGVDDSGLANLDRWREKENIFDLFTVMLAIATKENVGSLHVITNATGSLVDTGQKQILVTNHHVYSEFRLHQSKDPHSKLIMSGASGGPFLDISEVGCLSFDEEFDLAVLAVPPKRVITEGKLFAQSETWPPRPPRWECSRCSWATRGKEEGSGQTT